jgi:glycerol-3-phosphate O-acyltransferase
MSKKGPIVFPQVIDDIEQWPIYKLSEDRKDFVKEIEAFTLERIMRRPVPKVTDLLREAIYQERIRIKEEPWKVDPPKERQFWSRISKKLVRQSLDRPDAEAKANNQEILESIIHRYSEEIVGTFRISTFLFARRFLTWFFNRLLQAKQRGFWRIGGAKRRLAEKLIVKGELEKIRSLSTKGTLVVVPTHFSNLDSILIGYVLDLILGLPSFAYGAGLNLYNTGYTAYFMNRLGAYRVDRRKKNGIYLETLKAMSNLALQRGTNSLFFPGGTRSRSGALEDKLKLGLLSTTVEAQRAIFQKGGKEKIIIVPLVLGYHFVLEGPFLIESYLKQLGKERFLKSKDSSYSPLEIARFVWKVLAEGNDIALSFGQPMDVLGNPVDIDGHSFDQYGNVINIEEYFMSGGKLTANIQRESEYTKDLAEKIVERYYKDNIVLSSHLVSYAAFIMLQKQNPKLDLFGLLRLPEEDYIFSAPVLEDVIEQLRERLFKMKEAGEIKLSEAIYWDLPKLIKDGLTHLGTFHVKKPLKYNKKGEIISEDFSLLYYYHNRLANYKLGEEVRLQKEALVIVDEPDESLA